MSPTTERRTSRVTETALRQVAPLSFRAMLWQRFTAHRLTKVISLGLAILVWALIDQQIIDDLFAQRELHVVTGADADAERSLRVQVPPHWMVLSVQPMIVDLRIVGRKVERDLLRLPLTMVVDEQAMGLYDSRAPIERVVLDARHLSLPGLTDPKVTLSDRIRLTLSRRTAREFRLVLVQPSAAPDERWSSSFNPKTVTVQGPQSRFESLGAANFEIPIALTPAEIERGGREILFEPGRIEAALSDRHRDPTLEVTSGLREVRLVLTPEKARERTAPLQNVRVSRSETDPLVELDQGSPRVTSLTVSGQADLVERIATDPELARRLAAELVVIAELGRPLELALEPGRSARPIGEWVDVKIDKEFLYVSPLSLEALRRKFPEFAALKFADPKEFLQRARLRAAEGG